MVGAFLTAYTIVLVQDTMVTEEMWEIVQSLAILMPILSRGPQIITILRERSTGALAFPTVFLGFAGSLSRLFTVMAESDDFYYQLTFILSGIFNTIIVLQFYCFWNEDKPVSDKKVDEVKEIKKKKDTKKT